MEYKILHVNTSEYYRFSHCIPTDIEEYKLLIKKIISICQIKNKCQFYYLDEEKDWISLKSFQDAETMFRLRPLGQPIRIFVENI